METIAIFFWFVTAPVGAPVDLYYHVVPEGIEQCRIEKKKFLGKIILGILLLCNAQTSHANKDPFASFDQGGFSVVDSRFYVFTRFSENDEC